ncbi:MAG: DEAD/DEAH box helicase [Bacilli bacterium]|nr:DEAD/DEAH box helicase [Bacilli bacterium]
MQNDIKTVSLQILRDRLIERLDRSEDATLEAKKIAPLLYDCGLTVYSKNDTVQSAIYQAYAQSIINPDVSLHPEQLRVISEIYNNPATIVSAPTSFGKTYCIFEYIARFLPHIIVLVVPTLALTKEYINTVAGKSSVYFPYKVHTAFDAEEEYDFNEKHLFVLTHEKAISNSVYRKLPTIDFLVIDEIYKLERSMGDDRTLLLNMAYYHLSQLAKKYCLLAPYISGVSNIETLNKQPKMVVSDYAPVINQIERISIIREKDREPEVLRTIKERTRDKKTLIYFPTTVKVNKFIQNCLSNEPNAAFGAGSDISEFISWAKNEIHEDWSVVRALEKGYLTHYGPMPSGARDYLLYLFNSDESGLNKLLCTSTLLEGVNTKAEYLIISNPRKGRANGTDAIFSAFDFYNLAGRTGRLNMYLVGHVYYIKKDGDPAFENKSDAKVNVQFELSEKSEDILIQTDPKNVSAEVAGYFNSINISIEDFVSEIGPSVRLTTFKMLFKQYSESKTKLMDCLKNGGKNGLVKLVSSICQVKSDDHYNPVMLSAVLYGRNRSIRDIVNDLLKDSYFLAKGYTVDRMVGEVVRIRNGYLEHGLLIRTSIIVFLMKKEGVNEEYINTLTSKIIDPIQRIYGLNSPARKMLRSIGVYERDTELILNYIGEDFKDLNELKERLVPNLHLFFSSLSFISRFEIRQFVQK